MRVSMVSRVACLLAGTVLAVAAPSREATAQAERPGSPTAVAATPVATAIPESEILAAADQDQRLIDRVNRRLATGDATARLQRELDAVSAPVDEKLRHIDAEQLRRLPVMRLESLERHWKFDAEQLARWDAEMHTTTAPYAADAAALAQRRSAWSATRAAAASMLPLLAERADTMISGLSAAEAGLADAIARQIALRQRAAIVRAKVDDGRAEVAKAIADLDRRLWRLDVAPLWSRAPEPPPGAPAFDPVDRGLDIEMQFAKAYGAAAPPNMRALRLLELALLPVLLWLAWRARRRSPADGDDPDMSRVLRRPLSIWVLLSMVGVLALERDAPLIVHEFAMLAALGPVLRLLPARRLRLLGAWPYVVAGLFVLDRLGVALTSGSSTYRLGQLALTGLALALTLWLLHRTWARSSIAPEAMGPRLRQIQQASAVVLSIAAIANVVGNVSLAAMLTSGVIGSGYFAILLLAGFSVCVALLKSLLGQAEARKSRLLEENGAAMLDVATKLLGLAASLGWLVYTMAEFRVLRPAQELLSVVLGHDFEVGELSISLGHLLVFAVSVFIAAWSARIVRRLLRAELHDRAVLPRGVGNSVASLSYYAVLILGLLFALSAAGFQVSQLALVFGALGVGIGFGLQTIVGNFVSGLVLMFERPIQPGDVIEVGPMSGRVREIGMRATTVRTFEGADVLIPNITLLNSNLVNWTLHDRHRRIEVQVPLAYGTDPARAIALLRDAAIGTAGIAAEPAPSVYFVGYANSALNFSVRVWTHDVENWVAIRSEVLSRLLRAVSEAGLSIPFNQYDLNVRTLSPEVADVLREARAAGPDAGQASKRYPTP